MNTRQLIRPELARRVVWEAAAVEAKFPGRFRMCLGAGGVPVWEGSVPVEGREFPVSVMYPPAYPALPPQLETRFPLPGDCPHLLRRGPESATLCWIDPHAQAARRRWDPQRHTAATVLLAAQRWFLSLLVWQALGRWPVPDAWRVTTP